MKRRRIDGWVYTTTVEVEQFAAFDLSTRRFIAYVLALVPELQKRLLTSATVAGNDPAPFILTEEERNGRAEAYSRLPELRACRAKGDAGKAARRLLFADLLVMARFDLRWKRLINYPEFHFCYERLAGPQWRELLPLCWQEAASQKRSNGPVQLPLAEHLREDDTVPNSLEKDWPPTFYPSLADADSLGSPLLAGL